MIFFCTLPGSDNDVCYVVGVTDALQRLHAQGELAALVGSGEFRHLGVDHAGCHGMEQPQCLHQPRGVGPVAQSIAGQPGSN
jgi:hypothetical protein